MRFQRETLVDARGDIEPLLTEHYREIAHYSDILLDPDWEFYCSAEEGGMLRVFTARDGDRLIGYGVFFVRTNAHYKSSVQAMQDVFFILPEYRGARLGAKFVAYCDVQLKSENVQVIYHHIKAAHDWGPMLVNSGYELVDLIYAKRLD